MLLSLYDHRAWQDGQKAVRMKSAEEANTLLVRRRGTSDLTLSDPWTM